MDHLRRLGNSISIPIPPDENGFTGRECPNPDCEGYFKIEFGTGLKGEGLPCHCPYCGHTAGHESFLTKEQIEYFKSVALKSLTDAFYNDLKKLEFDHRPTGGLGIGLSMKVTRRGPTPIHYYREKELETEVVCRNCTLRYSVYGVFAFCPDCGQHNSLQILQKNLGIVGKMLDLAKGADREVAEKLIENALEDCVSTFDGFGRALCHVHRWHAADPDMADEVRFQNLAGARQAVLGLFSVDLAAQVTADEWQPAVRGFQKRHIFAHKMGVVDEDYVRNTGDSRAVVGRKVNLESGEVKGLVEVVSKLAEGLFRQLTQRVTNP